jgi:uncharacterized protein HemX
MFALLGLGRVQLYIAAAVAVVGIYFFWKHNVEQQALMEYNQRQLEQVVKDQQAFQQKMQQVESKQRTIEADLASQNEAVTNSLKGVQDYLSSNDAKKQDVPSSGILKNTVKELRSEKK